MTTETQIIAKPSAQDLFIIREFDAPREMVFKAFSEPGIMLQFYAPFDLTLVFNEADYRTGGHYNWSNKRGEKVIGMNLDYRKLEGQGTSNAFCETWQICSFNLSSFSIPVLFL